MKLESYVSFSQFLPPYQNVWNMEIVINPMFVDPKILPPSFLPPKVTPFQNVLVAVNLTFGVI